MSQPHAIEALEPPARPRELTLEDYQSLAAFREALRRFLAFSETGAAAHGVTTQQHQALLAIKAGGGLSVGELGETLLIRTHSAGELVGRLAQRGLASRSVAKDDRRRVVLSLTREGERVLAAISRSNLASLRGNLPIFTELLERLEALEGGRG